MFEKKLTNNSTSVVHAIPIAKCPVLSDGGRIFKIFKNNTKNLEESNLWNTYSMNASSVNLHRSGLRLPDTFHLLYYYCKEMCLYIKSVPPHYSYTIVIVFMLFTSTGSGGGAN